MLSTIRMPQMGVSDESAILCKWLVREGERICRGQPVFSLETDKATFQYEAESDGFLVRILTGEGEEAAVGSPVGILSGSPDFEESELEAFLKKMNGPDEMSPGQTEAKAVDPATMNTGFPLSGTPVCSAPDRTRKVSPRAKRTARELGVDMTTIGSGSGPEGRILERDVLEAVQTKRILPGFNRKTEGICSGRPLTQADRVNMRPICMETAGQTGFVCRPVDARRILAQCTPQNCLTPGAVICHALARLLLKTPELNARRHADRICEYSTVHLRLTAKTTLCTLKPVIRRAEAYTPDELAVLMRNAADRCRRFASKPQEFQDGTFTVADLSAYGVDCFTPELTPPELCALGIGAVAMRPMNSGQGGCEAFPAIRLTLAYDRAGVDVFRAAGFLNELASLLEPGGTDR